jgi:hypothetical protein
MIGFNLAYFLLLIILRETKILKYKTNKIIHNYFFRVLKQEWRLCGGCYV